MSDHCSWLDEWCPECLVAPGTRCRRYRWDTRGQPAVDVERWSSRDELGYALEAPVWDRFGSFAGQPFVRGEVIWTGGDRSVVIAGTRGDRPFEEKLT